MRLKESGLSLFESEEIRRRSDNKVESESVDDLCVATVFPLEFFSGLEQKYKLNNKL